MKSIKFIALAAALTVCCAASAQTYRTASISYVKYAFSEYGFSADFPGAAFGVAVANKLSVNAPVLYEIGADIIYNSGTAFEDTKANLASIRVPLNLMFEIDVDKLKVLPFAGLNVTGHLAGNTKYSEDGYTETESLFKDDEDDEIWGGYGAKRFQLGAQLGVKAIYDKFMFGVSYNPYLTELMDDSSSNLLFISLGILF